MHVLCICNLVGSSDSMVSSPHANHHFSFTPSPQSKAEATPFLLFSSDFRVGFPLLGILNLRWALSALHFYLLLINLYHLCLHLNKLQGGWPCPPLGWVIKTSPCIKGSPYFQLFAPDLPSAWDTFTSESPIIFYLLLQVSAQLSHY